MKFSFKELEKATNERFVCEPDGLEPIVFHLAPIDAETNFLIRQFQHLANTPDVDRALARIGANRIVNWEGVQDEEGNDVVFNQESFAKFFNLFAAVPYLLRVGGHTLDAVFPSVSDSEEDSEGKQLVLDEAALPQEASQNNSMTTPEG